MNHDVAKALEEYRAQRRARPKRKRKAVPAPELYDPKAGRAWKRSLVAELEDTELERVREHAFVGKVEARAARAAELEQAREKCGAARERLRGFCSARRRTVRGRARQKIESAAELERAAVKERRKSKELERERTKRWRRGKSIEAVQESDDVLRSEVAAIDPRLLPLLERVKGRIKGSPKKSRAEAFFHYVHENPDDVSASIEASVPSDVELAASYEAWAEREAS